MKRIGILHLISSLDVGGAELMLFKTLPRLKDFNHIICALSPVGEIGTKLKELGFKIYSLETGKKFSPKTILEFRKIIKKERPAAISTYLVHADIFGRIFGRIFGVKKIICSLRSQLGDPKYKAYFIIERFTSFLVTKYTAVSRAVKNEFIKNAHISPEKIVIIYNGVDLKEFENLASKEHARKSLGLTNFRPLIGYVSKLRKEKNHPYLIKAFAAILNSYPSAALILAGDGPEKENLVHLTKELKIEKNVIFLGDRDDIPQILAGLDVFVSVSLYEGLSNAILEAMAAGRPIVASDIPPNHELIENNKDGFLVPLSDQVILAEKIITLLQNQDLQRLFSNNVREKVKNFSIENTIKNLGSFYQKIVLD